MNLPTLDDEVRQMRDRLASLEREMASFRERTPAWTFPRFVRPAMTWTEVSGDYPSTSEIDDFPFVFCDSDFTKRSASKDGDAAFLNRFHLPRETKLFVLEDSGKYLIVNAAFNTIRFVELTTDMSGQSASVNFLDGGGGSGTASDSYNLWSKAVSTDVGRVQWRNGYWQFIDIYRCGALTGS